MTGRVVGVDIGGTTTRVAVGDGGGGILGIDRFSTRRYGDPEVLVRRSVGTAAELLRSMDAAPEDVDGLGVVVPGSIDVPSGTVRTAANLGWDDVPLGRLFEAAFDREARVENDANAAAMGEWRSSGWTEEGLFVYLTISTGIGAGLVIDGEVWHGRDGLAGEIGHTIISMDGPPCACGARGCLEAMASGHALERLAGEAVRDGLLPEGVNTPSDLAGLAASGDGVATEIMDGVAEVLAAAMKNLIFVLNPAAICLGGGVIQGTELFGGVKSRVAVDPLLGSRLPHLIRSSLGDDAGIIGALQIGAQRTYAR